MLTGAHVASVAAVAGGHADLAAIDCVTWAHLKRWRPEATGKLRVLAWTAAMPGLPLITASGTPDETRRILADVLDEVAADPALADVRATLLRWSGEPLRWGIRFCVDGKKEVLFCKEEPKNFWSGVAPLLERSVTDQSDIFASFFK
jgi:hypothetical protein